MAARSSPFYDPSPRGQGFRSSGRTDLDNLVAGFGAEAIDQGTGGRFALWQIFSEYHEYVSASLGGVSKNVGQHGEIGAVPVETGKDTVQERSHAIAQERPRRE